MPIKGLSLDFSSKQFSRSSRRRSDEPRRDFSLRALGVRILGLAIFLVLLATLARTQVLEGAYFRSLADGNRAREVVLPAPGGIIFDRNDKPLVANVPAYRLVKCNKEETKCTANTISRDQAITIQAEGVPPQTDLVIDSTRLYLEREKTAHILGYVSEISASELATQKEYRPGDKIGRGGVEESYEKDLQGTPGKELVEVDAMGRRLKVLS